MPNLWRKLLGGISSVLGVALLLMGFFGAPALGAGLLGSMARQDFVAVNEIAPVLCSFILFVPAGIALMLIGDKYA